MHVLVTGGAGFIGANLCRTLLATPAGHGRHRPRRPLDGQPRQPRGHRRSRGLLPGQRAAPRPADGADRRRRRDRAPRRAAVGAAFGRRPRRRARRQRHRHAARAGGRPPRREPAHDRRVELLGVRRHRGPAQARGPADQPALAVRGQQARGRGLRDGLRGQLRPAGARVPLLQRLRSPAAGAPRLRRGDPRLRRPPRWPGSRCRSTATAPRPATSRRSTPSARS